MTLSTTVSRIAYVGAGLTGPYAAPFRIFSTDDLRVTKRSALGIESTLALTTDWALTVGSSVGDAAFSITLVVALAVGETLVLRRDPSLLQPTSVRNQAAYFGSVHEDEFDRLVMQLQAINDRLRRTFALAETYDPDGFTTTLIPVDGSVLGWSGGQLQNVLIDDSADVVLPALGRTVPTLSALLADNTVTFNVKDFGAVGDGVTDDTAALQLCFATANALIGVAAPNAQDLGCSVYLPRGTYKCTGQLSITKSRMHVYGDGKYASTILFAPGNGVLNYLFVGLNSNGGDLGQGSFKRFGLRATGTGQKIGFNMTSLSEYVFEDIIVASSWVGNGGNPSAPSIGFRINGHELVTFNRLGVFADQPFHFFANPLNPSISADHFHLHDIYAAAQSSVESCFLFDVDCVVTNLTMDGYQAWIGGTHGVYAQASSACQTVNIRNARYEQPGATGGFAVRWEATTKSLLLEGCGFGGTAAPTNGGVKLRHVRSITLLNCVYTGSGGGTAVALDLDATCDDLWLLNTFLQATSLATLAGFEEAFSVPKIDTSAPCSPTSYWFRTGSAAPRALRFLGNNVTYDTFDIAAGATHDFDFNGSAIKNSIVQLVGYSATGPIEEGGIALVTGSSAKLIAGTTNFAVSNVGSKLCILWNAGPTVQVLNNTAQTLKCILQTTWRQ